MKNISSLFLGLQTGGVGCGEGYGAELLAVQLDNDGSFFRLDIIGLSLLSKGTSKRVPFQAHRFHSLAASKSIRFMEERVSPPPPLECVLKTWTASIHLTFRQNRRVVNSRPLSSACPAFERCIVLVDWNSVHQPKSSTNSFYCLLLSSCGENNNSIDRLLKIIGRYHLYVYIICV